MSDNNSDAEVGHRRKSARISALEEKEKEKRKLRAAVVGNFDSSSSKGKAPAGSNVQRSSLTRGRKQKRLEDIDVFDLAQDQSQEDADDSDNGDHSTRTDQQPNGLSGMPERRVLNFALAVLQRRDTHNIFAQPVDPDEVENYYNIIKEPMDFGTMKTKLQEGKYSSLDQFELDVFLICNNAMRFNSPTTIYYKEARAMHLLAQAVFSTLRTDPRKLESEFSLTRRRPAKKASRKNEIKALRRRTPRSTGVKICPSSLEARDNGDSTFLKREDPKFYRPWTSFCSENEKLVSSVYKAKKMLQIDENGRSQYKQSLIRFVRGLGPTPKRLVVNRLMRCYRPQTQSQTTQKLPPMPSLMQRPVSHNDQFPITSFQNPPTSSNLLSRNIFRHSFADRDPVPEPRNLMTPSKEPISQSKYNSLLGKRPMLDNSMARDTATNEFSHNNHLLGKKRMLDNSMARDSTPNQFNHNNHLLGNKPMLEYNISPDTAFGQHSHVRGKMPMLDNNIAHNTANLNFLGGFSRENRTFQSVSSASTNLQGNTYLRQNFVPQQKQGTENGQFWLASHLKVIPVEDRNNPSGKKFMTMDMLAQSDDQTRKQQVQKSEYDELSANWKSRLRGLVNRGDYFLQSFDLFSKASEIPTAVQSCGPSAQGMIGGDRLQYLTNSNNYTNNSKHIGKSSGGYFSSDEFATLQMLLNNEYTPLPSYDELDFVHEKADSPLAYHHHHGRANTTNQQEGRYLKDIDPRPNLSLRL